MAAVSWLELRAKDTRALLPLRARMPSPVDNVWMLTMSGCLFNGRSVRIRVMRDEAVPETM